MIWFRSRRAEIRRLTNRAEPTWHLFNGSGRRAVCGVLAPCQDQREETREDLPDAIQCVTCRRELIRRAERGRTDEAV